MLHWDCRLSPLLQCGGPEVALLGPRDMSDLSPQSAPKRTRSGHCHDTRFMSLHGVNRVSQVRCACAQAVTPAYNALQQGLSARLCVLAVAPLGCALTEPELCKMLSWALP